MGLQINTIKNGVNNLSKPVVNTEKYLPKVFVKYNQLPAKKPKKSILEKINENFVNERKKQRKGLDFFI